MVEKITTKSFEETQAFAEQFAQKLSGGDVVLLYGNLGAGKTTFVQGLAKGLGITHRIISPTFIVLRTYEIPNVIASEAFTQSKNEGKQSQKILKQVQDDKKSSRQARTIKTFYHVDLYRLETEKDIEGIGLLDMMGKSENIVVIEWPEKLGLHLPQNAWKITIESQGEDNRSVTIEK